MSPGRSSPSTVERPIQQRRPTLVVAAGLGHGSNLLWVLTITAAANRRWPDDVRIDDHLAAGLPIPSVVRTAKIATIAASVAGGLGALPQVKVREVIAVLRKRPSIV